MMLNWLFLLTQTLEILSLVFMSLIIKKAKQILKIWSPHFSWRHKEIDCVTENIWGFYFLIDTKHPSSLGTVPWIFGIKPLTF